MFIITSSGPLTTLLYITQSLLLSIFCGPEQSCNTPLSTKVIGLFNCQTTYTSFKFSRSSSENSRTDSTFLWIVHTMKKSCIIICYNTYQICLSDEQQIELLGLQVSSQTSPGRVPRCHRYPRKDQPPSLIYPPAIFDYRELLIIKLLIYNLLVKSVMFLQFHTQHFYQILSQLHHILVDIPQIFLSPQESYWHSPGLQINHG